MVDRGKLFLTCSLITMQNLAVVSDTVHTHVAGPNILGDAGTRPLLTGAWLTPRITLLPTFLRFGTVSGHKKLGLGPRPFGRGRVTNAPETRYCPTCVIVPNFVALS